MRFPKGSKKQADTQHDIALDMATERVHAACLATLGTSNAPRQEKLRESIASILELMHDPDYAGDEYFQLSEGLLIRVERRDRNWDYFQVFVPATSNMIWYKEK